VDACSACGCKMPKLRKPSKFERPRMCHPCRRARPAPPCRHCGGPVTSTGHGKWRAYCSSACQEAAGAVGNRKAASRQCSICGAEYFNSRHDRKKYCGDICQYIARYGASCDVVFPQCASCFAPMPPRSRRQYCGKPCGWRTSGRRQRVFFPSCRSCGIVFCSRTSQAKRCRMCRVLHDYEAKVAQGRRKVSNLVDYVGARDRWKCGICGKRVSSEPFTQGNYWSKSVDHIVPESEGKRLGWSREEIDNPANLRVAHMRCNSVRQANGGNEQLMLVG
jgi:hypothetical protein